MLTDEELRKFMRLAKNVEDAENPCLSRSIGTVIVDPVMKNVVSHGHNGPPEGAPRCDDHNYLGSVVWPQLSPAERKIALADARQVDGDDDYNRRSFQAKHAGCGKCPRRLINAPAGVRLELCSCAHSEAMAVTKAGRSVAGMWLFAHCGVPCIECTKVIIESRIAKVFCIHDNPDYPHSEACKTDYSYASRHLYGYSKTELICRPAHWWGTEE